MRMVLGSISEMKQKNLEAKFLYIISCFPMVFDVLVCSFQIIKKCIDVDDVFLGEKLAKMLWFCAF